MGNHQILIEKCHLDDCMNNFPRNFPVTRLFVYLFVFKELHPPPPRIFDGVTLARELIRNVISFPGPCRVTRINSLPARKFYKILLNYLELVSFRRLSSNMISIVAIFLWTTSVTICAAIIIFVGLVIYLLYVHAKYDHLPGPKRGGFFTGNMTLVYEKRTKLNLTIHQIWAELALQHSPMFVFWFFHRPVVIVTDAQLVKEVLITKNLPRDKFGYSHLASLFGERMLGQGLLSEVSEEEWRWKRATLDPGFYRPSIVGMIDNFNTTCDSFLQRLESLADGKAEVSMAEELVRINLDLIAKVFSNS